jgi:hypothetical protein
MLWVEHVMKDTECLEKEALGRKPKRLIFSFFIFAIQIKSLPNEKSRMFICPGFPYPFSDGLPASSQG